MKHSLLVAVVVIWMVGEGFAHHHHHNSTPRLKARTSVFDSKPRSSFIDLPGALWDPEMRHYEKVELEKSCIYPLDSYCICGDPKFCLLFDRKGYLAGIQVSYPKVDVANVHPHVHNFSNPNYIETNIYGTPCYSVRIFVRNPNKLPGYNGNHEGDRVTEIVRGDFVESNRRTRLPEGFEGLWTVLDGEMVRFDEEFQPASSDLVKRGFTLLGCTPRLGLAYVTGFQETSTTTCPNSFFLSLLYDNDALVGFTHIVPGKLSPRKVIDVFNVPDGGPLEEIVPNPPLCFTELRKYGLSAVNIFLIEDPWNIRCKKSYCRA